jgi:hypothetical protein
MTMTDDRVTPEPSDIAIRAMFDRRARRAEAFDLRPAILAATQAQPQVRGWRMRLALPALPSVPRLLVLVLLAIAIIGIGLLGIGMLRREARPEGVAADFIRPFEYGASADSSLHRVPGRAPEFVEWVAGPTLPPIPGDQSGSGRHPDPTQARGVFVGSGLVAWAHGTDRRFVLRTAPAEFLTDLRDMAHTPMGRIEATTVDGRPALAVVLPGTGGSDIHLTGPMTGLSRDYVLVNLPARLTVLEIDRRTVFILSWARSPADLDAWLPVADGFVSTFHFLPEAPP